ncbi:phosphate ABC transporter substrate-binding protein [Pectinatus brassicae]|uniref:Phosphate-binding protein n=1 Tax=Pectinatus brassicae TaxID=862415 RepID=A0A840UV52_9FIRM|nr:phosphate ABC transporter substrate-binding protein [Pectinatus brassicae]MBB5336694.1 phosphate transport system substrate-binding protein [Pectinatus brassicae]
MLFSGKKKLLAVLGTMVVSTMLFAGCGGNDKAASTDKAATDLKGKVSASGSTALLPLLKPAQEAFEKEHKDVTVNIAGGGSFTGMNQVGEGAVDIGNSDVFLPNEYKDKGLVDHKVVVEPFVFITNKDNKVSNLSTEQIVGILTGKITNWKEVGGEDKAITLIHRAKSSGSRATIADVVLKGQQFTDNASIQDSNGAVLKGVATTPGAIGYVDAPYADKSVKVLDMDGVKYSAQAIIDGKYHVYGYGHMYTKGEPKGAVKAFIDYVMSDAFQNEYVEKLGFIPVSKMKK